MCGWICSSPCLLTRPSGSSDSWPRNKSRVIAFPNELESKLVTESGTTPREDTGEEPSYVSKEPCTWGGTHIYAVSVSLGASQVALVVKNLPASAGEVRDVGLIPGLGRSPGEGNANSLQYSRLENSMDRGGWQATICKVAKSQTQLSNWTHNPSLPLEVGNFNTPFNQSVNSVSQSCPTLCDPMNRSTPGLPVHHQLPESTQTNVHWVGDAIQPSRPLSSPSPPALNLSKHQGLFKWVNSSHEVARVLKFQLQHQSFQWTPRTDLL